MLVPGVNHSSRRRRLIAVLVAAVSLAVAGVAVAPGTGAGRDPEVRGIQLQGKGQSQPSANQGPPENPGPPFDSVPPENPGPPENPDGRNFTITSAHVDGLHPGASEELVITFHNPNAFAIRVFELTITWDVLDPAGDCPPTDISVPGLTDEGVLQFDPPVEIPRQDTEDIKTTVTMDVDPHNGCQTKAFRLTYTGLADKA